MKTKNMSYLALLVLGISAVAIAEEYKAPAVGVKLRNASTVVSKTAKFDEGYKVENYQEADRQIASEEESDREPSSVAAKKKKEFAPVEEVKPFEEPTVEPKPWLYRNQNARQN